MYIIFIIFLSYDLSYAIAYIIHVNKLWITEVKQQIFKVFISFDNILTACDIGKMTLFGRNPEVWGTSIKDYFKILWGSSNANDTIILSIQIVGKRFWLRKISLHHVCLVYFSVIFFELFPNSVYLMQSNSWKKQKIYFWNLH